ncbi:hypothetical protein EU244_025085 [Rhodococcus qingshengii]|uniref:hypothetical protein n=1 Tax=Rhodococcus qingshengii TaxID=334542 RepID=UPI0010A63422|nr:hypothetical protein [Rhodococcus qingshengii]THJ70716.1 hypothetical protein EU244_15365 [Rhodococcus qingshengii]
MSKVRSDLRPDLARAQRLLDEQKHGAVVVDKFGDAWQLNNIYWHRAFGWSGFDEGPWSSWDLCQRAPFVVVHDAVPKRPTRRTREESL